MRYITVNENDIVFAIRFGKEIVLGEIESEVGEIGQQLQADGSFIDLPQPIVDLIPTIDERLDGLQDDVDYLILKSEGVI